MHPPPYHSVASQQSFQAPSNQQRPFQIQTVHPKLEYPLVGADLSRPSPIYRPSSLVTFNSMQLYLHLAIYSTVRSHYKQLE